MTYRLDHRSEKQFKKDIHVCHKAEAEIAVRIGLYFKQQLDRWPIIIPNGVDVTGGYISNGRKVSADQDFIIEGSLVEITHSKHTLRSSFHQKCNKVKKAIKDNSQLVFVNGFVDNDRPKFVIMTRELIEMATALAIAKYGITMHPGVAGRAIPKDCYRYDIALFDGLWHELPVLTNKIPKAYKNILNSTLK